MSSSKKGQIESAKIVVGDVFSRFWFRIPDYQRAYVWGKDEISELIDDVIREKLRQISRDKIVLADSRYHLTEFRGVTAVKPNQEEALAAVGMQNGGGLEAMGTRLG